MTVSTTYSLRHKASGKLAGVRTVEPFEAYAPREYRLVLMTDNENCQAYEVDTADKAALVLAIDTPLLSSSYETPNWNGLNMDEFEVVMLERTTSVTAVKVDLPVRFAYPVESRNTAPMVAARYLGRSVFIPNGLRINFVEMPDNETLESLKSKCDGKKILLGPMDTILTSCVGVFETPEEYAELFKGKNSVGLITSGFA